MVRFIHTADWHLGLKTIQLGEKGREAKAMRFETVARIIKLAKEKSVDFIIITGDTFDDHNVDNIVVRRAVEILNAAAPIAVYILPGNHDPFIAGGVWDRTEWEDRIGDHVILLKNEEKIAVNEIIEMYPCPLKQKKSPIDPTEWIPIRTSNDHHIRIGIAHGNLDILSKKSDFPIAPDRCKNSGLNYLALGEWHSSKIMDRLAYPGSPEPTSFNDSDTGKILVVEIKDADSEPVIEPITVGKLKWGIVSKTINDQSDLISLETFMKELENPTIQVIRMNIKIESMDTEIFTRLSTLRKQLGEDIFYMDWSEDDLVMPPLSLPKIPEGILSQVDDALSKILSSQIPDGPAHKFASENHEDIENARLLLHRLSREE